MGNAKKGHHPDNDWEVAEKLSPDPFSEEDTAALRPPFHNLKTARI